MYNLYIVYIFWIFPSWQKMKKVLFNLPLTYFSADSWYPKIWFGASDLSLSSTTPLKVTKAWEKTKQVFNFCLSCVFQPLYLHHEIKIAHHFSLVSDPKKNTHFFNFWRFFKVPLHFQCTPLWKIIKKWQKDFVPKSSIN